LNNQLLDEQHDSSTFVFSLALALSLVMHFAIMRALPWLEAVKTKPPVTIMAELQPSPPPPPSEVQSIKPLVKPETVKVEQPKPTPKTQAVAVPVLATERTEQVTNNYTVPNIPQPAVISSEPSAVAAPESTTAAVSSSSSNNTVSSIPSTSEWEDSDVWDEYGRNLQRLCERYKQYPVIAIRRGWQGAGKVSVRFSAQGQTTSITIEKSTGQKSLDDQALEMVRKSLGELPVPAKFKGREFKLTIPVDFKLE
jgi:protein TonB